jgi:CRP-like cAMP-binding protein
MNDEVIPLLKVHAYFQGASDEALEEVVRLGRVAQYPAGSIVHEADVMLTTVGFELRGRLKAFRVDTHGTESLFRMIERGEQFGMMVGAVGEPVPIRIVALEPTTVLRLRYEEALELTLARPELRRLWLKTYAGSLRKFFFGAAPKRSAMMLALIHDSPATRPAAERLIQRLSDVGEQLAVFSDSDRRLDSPNVRFRPLREDGRDSIFPSVTERGGLSQHRLQSLFKLDSERVGLTTRPLGRNGKGFANVHAAIHRTVDPARVRGVFLEPFQGFQKTLGGRLAINISTRIRFERLGERAIVQMSPTGGLFQSGTFPSDQCGQNGHAQLLDPRHGCRRALTGEVLLLKRAQHAVNQPRQPLGAQSNLGGVEILNFLEGQKGFAEPAHPLDEAGTEMGPPAQALFDHVQNRLDRLSKVPAESISQRDRMDDYLTGWLRLGPGLGRGPGDEGDSVHDIPQTIVPPRDHALRKYHQRPASIHQNL